MKGARSRNARKRIEAPHKVRKNPLIAAGIVEVDYKNVPLLRTFVSDRGKIRSRRVTGLTPQQQRQVAIAVKNAREMALLPYYAGK
ncbi:30S ribosomal protein S18 [Nocardia arizonensis]|uniref:30S ribosomal protein S18 n=1 Tax=Nocardia arizonensis TaxID=1141647 RepID=UPI0006D28F91|nr:30S ribosomal protein S18 [Nocardia arizonensis]